MHFCNSLLAKFSFSQVKSAVALLMIDSLADDFILLIVFESVSFCWAKSDSIVS